ncbi:MAG: type II toxin-antitoxin system HicA family toxin [Elusimicrobiota bacterium]|nr:type II toxin-antitoxin system HicA family toxin [Elusimicrobiota bacterium]
MLKIHRLLKAHGFSLERQSSSHLIYDRPDLDRPIVLPYHGKEIKFCYIIQIRNMLNMTTQELIRELSKI